MRASVDVNPAMEPYAEAVLIGSQAHSFQSDLYKNGTRLYENVCHKKYPDCPVTSDEVMEYIEKINLLDYWNIDTFFSATIFLWWMSRNKNVLLKQWRNTKLFLKSFSYIIAYCKVKVHILKDQVFIGILDNLTMKNLAIQLYCGLRVVYIIFIWHYL